MTTLLTEKQKLPISDGLRQNRAQRQNPEGKKNKKNIWLYSTSCELKSSEEASILQAPTYLISLIKEKTQLTLQ